MNDFVGWDIGGVNTKVARVTGGEVVSVRGRPYELQRDPQALAPLLRTLAREVGADASAAHAVTMTAELSQMFRTKREGVGFVLDAVDAAFPSSVIRVHAVDGRFLSPGEARQEPMSVAAANWAATARVVAWHHPDALLIDIGTTTTDIVPIVGGSVVAEGRTDPERLASGELVYTGVLRTPVEAIVRRVPLRDTSAGVSAEGFALAGDVHVWRGDLAPADYTVAAPDGRPATREFAGERIARVVCADREMLDDAAVSAIAGAIADAQVACIAGAIQRVLARHRSLRMAMVTGLGAFLGKAAARAVGLQTGPLMSQFDEAGARCAPAVAVALLLEEVSKKGAGEPTITSPNRPGSGAEARATAADGAVVDLVVKLGGSLLADIDQFNRAIEAIWAAARHQRVVVVPGGGPFADAVRDADRRHHLPDAASHWMAVLAMEQHAHLIAAKLVGAALVVDARTISAAIDAGQVPVIAPMQWMRKADPLPHSWDATSDSIAAWMAGELGARQLVLIKPTGATGANVVDTHFRRSLPAGVEATIATVDQLVSVLGP